MQGTQANTRFRPPWPA